MATTISTQDIVDAKRDIDDIGKAVNEKVIVSPRYGDDFKSLPMITEEFQDAIETAAAAGAGANGWTDLLIQTEDGSTQRTKNASFQSQIDNKADTSSVAAALVLKANQTYVDSQDTSLQSQINQKASAAYLDAALTDQTQMVNDALSQLSTLATKFYPTLAEANADIANIAINQPIQVGEVGVNGGLWYKATAVATSLTKSAYDPLQQAKGYTDSNTPILNVSEPSNISMSSLTILNSQKVKCSYDSTSGTGRVQWRLANDIPSGTEVDIYVRLQVGAGSAWRLEARDTTGATYLEIPGSRLIPDGVMRKIKYTAPANGLRFIYARVTGTVVKDIELSVAVVKKDAISDINQPLANSISLFNDNPIANSGYPAGFGRFNEFINGFDGFDAKSKSGRIYECGDLKQTDSSLHPIAGAGGAIVFNENAGIGIKQKSELSKMYFLPTAGRASPTLGGFTCTGITQDNYGRMIIADIGQSAEGGSTYEPALHFMSNDFSQVIESWYIHDIAALVNVRSVQGIVFDPKDESIWLTDLGNSRLRHISKDKTNIATNISGLSYYPNGLALDHTRRELYVMSSTNNVVHVYSADDDTGVEIRSFPISISTPDHLYIYKDTYLLVSTGDNATDGQVGVYLLDGTYLFTWSLPKSQAIEGIIIRDGKLLSVNDGSYHISANPARAVVCEYDVQGLPAVTSTSSIIVSALIKRGAMQSATTPIFSCGSPTASSGARGWGLYFVGSADTVRLIGRGGTSINLDWSLDVRSDATLVSLVISDNTAELFANGVSLGTKSMAGYTAGLSTDRISWGAEYDGSRPSDLTAYGAYWGSDVAQRERMEALLAWRFCRVDLLSDSNAFKNIAP